MKKINVKEKFDRFREYWTPKVIGTSNGQLIKIAKVKGEFIWHNHPEEDELFIVWKGTLILDFRDKSVEVEEGELIMVPKGVEHRPRTKGEEAWIMMIEPPATLNTGDRKGERTIQELEWI